MLKHCPSTIRPRMPPENNSIKNTENFKEEPVNQKKEDTHVIRNVMIVNMKTKVKYDI